MKLKYFIFVNFETAGHHFDYAKNFQSAVSSNEINIQFIGLQGLENKYNLKQWEPSIRGGRIRHKSSKERLSRLILNITWIFSGMPSFVRSISSIIEENDCLFLEDFSYNELLAFILALILSEKKQLIITILFRYTVTRNSVKSILYRLIFFIINFRFNKVVYFSDSNLLSHSWERLLKKKVIAFPIPYSLNDNEFIKPNRVFWWPGFPREDKGLKKIVNLLCSNQKFHDIKFILSADVKKYLTNSIVQVDYLDPILDTETYLSTFQKVQYVILPYDKIRYAESTSGIFVEAILQGCIPIVERNTWMAQELDKFALMDLIVDFDYFDLSDFIQKIESRSSHNDIKLKIMKKFYKKYHSIDSYRNQFIEALTNATK